jgi:hypothetical protein
LPIGWGYRYDVHFFLFLAEKNLKTKSLKQGVLQKKFITEKRTLCGVLFPN